jgi:hypothetical protein
MFIYIRNRAVQGSSRSFNACLAFGLEYPAVLDLAQLADRAIGGAEHRARALIQRAGAFF